MLIKHRFYSEHCVKGIDGQIVKDMSAVEGLVDLSENEERGKNHPSLCQRFFKR